VLSEFMALVREEGSSAIVATHNERLAAKMTASCVCKKADWAKQGEYQCRFMISQ